MRFACQVFLDNPHFRNPAYAPEVMVERAGGGGREGGGAGGGGGGGGGGRCGGLCSRLNVNHK